MGSDLLIYIGSAVIVFWGIAHIIPTKNIVAGFGKISRDNKLIITMEWVAEGIAFVFIGLLTMVVTLLVGPEKLGSSVVYILSASALIILSIWSLFTGARTSILPMKICPLVKSSVAIMFVLAVIL